MGVHTPSFSQISELKRRLRSNAPLAEKISRIEGMLEGCSAVVVTCGPSISTLRPEEIIGRTNGVLLCAIKQAHEYLSAQEDIHFINAFNMQRYQYRKEKSTIVISGRVPGNPPCFGRRPDCEFSISPAQDGNWVAKTMAFEKYTLRKTLVRPFGPGLFYETCLYFLIHLGIKRIVLIGWDLGSPGSLQLKHFYDNQYGSSDKQTSKLWQYVVRIAAKATGQNYVHLKNWLKYALGQRYNIMTQLQNDEMEIVARSSCKLYEWLRTQGIDLFIISDHSFACERIPRLSLNEIESVL